MNNRMYEHPATQRNLELFAERGARIVAPGTGSLASRGEWGVGRLAEPAEILRRSRRRSPWAARSTACACSSRPAARVSRSTRCATSATAPRGGWASRWRTRRPGAAPTSRSCARTSRCRSRPASASIAVETAAELEAALRAEFGAADVLVMAAAPADFRPATPDAGKIAKKDRDGLVLELEPTTDILAALAAARRPGQTLVGFAAEHGEGAVERGRGKLARKGLDAVVVNDISRSDIGFDAEENEVTIVLADGERPVARAPKDGVAGGDPRRRPGAEDERRWAQYRRGQAMSESAYDLFKKGSELLERGDFMAAAVPLERARELEPDKGSIREALGRAYFRSSRFEQAARSSRRLVERYPVNDYAHFCLGRSLEKTGRRAEASRHAALAAHMRPDRKDYQAFRERLRAA